MMMMMMMTVSRTACNDTSHSTRKALVECTPKNIKGTLNTPLW